MLVEAVTKEAEAILRQNQSLVARLASEKKRFENWLQLEIINALIPNFPFIEIEKPTKHIFTKAGQFNSEFTQAKNQLLDWDRLVTNDHAFFESRFPGLYKPKFHLIYGRASELDDELREKLQTEFSGTNRSFTTYDELPSRLKLIAKNLNLV